MFYDVAFQKLASNLLCYFMKLRTLKVAGGNLGLYLPFTCTDLRFVPLTGKSSLNQGLRKAAGSVKMEINYLWFLTQDVSGVYDPL